MRILNVARDSRNARDQPSALGGGRGGATKGSLHSILAMFTEQSAD